MNINKASKTELKELPGVGAATAQTIIDARPVTSADRLEAIVPPAAWVKLKEIELDFDARTPPSEESLAKESAEDPTEDTFTVEDALEVLRKANHPLLARPSTDLVREDLTLQRIRTGDPLGEGRRYLCLWNMRWGPALEARFPNDESVQAELEGRFRELGMEVGFAHYGPSVQFRTRARGLVPLLLFEIIEERKEEENGRPDNGQNE